MSKEKNLESIDKWDIRFIELAKHVSTWSKDPSTQVGAVIVDPQMRVVSLGFNGLPAGVEDKPEILNNRDLKLKLTIHGEENAIIFAQRSIVGCTLYTWPFMPCAPCSSKVIQAGISCVVAPENNNPRWVDSFVLTKNNFSEAGVELILLPGYFDQNNI